MDNVLLGGQAFDVQALDDGSCSQWEHCLTSPDAYSPTMADGYNGWMLNDSKGVGLYKPGYVSPYAENMMAIDENDKVAHAPLPFKTGTMNY